MKSSAMIAALWIAVWITRPSWSQEVDPPSVAPGADQSPAPEGPAKESSEPAAEKAKEAVPAAPVVPAKGATTELAEAAEKEKGDELSSTVEAKPAAEVDAGEQQSSTVLKARHKPALGLALDAPEIASLPGGVTPAYGRHAGRGEDWQFGFHGIVFLPLRVGLGKRENPGSAQKATVLHAPPRVPGDFETFGYTTTVPNPWTQLNFSYGNQSVMATVIIAARTVRNANGYFDPPDMLGINDAFLTFAVPLESERFDLAINLGAFANRYGHMGAHDLGRYGTPLIARISGTGLTATGTMGMGDLDLLFEAGIKGQFNKAPVGVEPAGWNGFADPNVGSSYAGHGHLSVRYKELAVFTGHLISAFTRDDRASADDIPDGRIIVGGADGRLMMGRFGHLFLGAAYTDAKTARAVSNVVRVLNAPGGPGLMREYLGAESNGTGSLFTGGGQYDFSLGNFLRYPDHFEGDGPDLLLSVFGIGTRVTSPNDKVFDGITKLKVGGELGYSALSWLALGARYDHVVRNLDDPKQSTAIATGRLILHSDWNSRDQVVLQYSYYKNGAATAVREGYPPVDDLTIVPDAHVLSLTASMWW